MTPGELMRLLGHFGYVARRRRSGSSHRVYRKPGAPSITVPINVKHLKVAYIVDTIKLLGLEDEDE